MHHVIKNQPFTPNSLFIGLIIIIFIKRALCQPSLAIVSELGSSSLQPLVEVRNGENVSLTCKFVNTNTESELDQLLFWTKHKKRKLSIIQVQTNKNGSPSTNLSFTPARLEHQGAYSCISPKYKLVKSVYVFIRFDPPRMKYFPPRHKRDNGDSNDPFVLPPLHDLSFDSVQKQVDELLKHYPPNEYPNWSTRDEDLYGNTNDENHHSTEPDNPNKSIAIVAVFIGAGVICIVLYVIYKCFSTSNNEAVTPENRTVPVNYTPATPVTPVNTNNHYSGFMFERNDSSIQNRPQAAVVHRNLDYLDLPPTYADSTENSRAGSMHSLHESANDAALQVANSSHGDCKISLPTYEEALENIALSNPSDFDNNSHTANGTGTDGNAGNATGGRNHRL